jgi:hypothetical protein
MLKGFKLVPKPLRACQAAVNVKFRPITLVNLTSLGASNPSFSAQVTFFVP